MVWQVPPAQQIPVFGCPVAHSQPLDSLLASQSRKLASQAPLQLLDAQVGVVMWLLEQTLPQAAQLSLSLVVLISHPSICLFKLQSAVPPAQAPVQVPLAPGGPQVRVGMLLVEQTVPQAPQLRMSVLVLISHPSVCLFRLQSANPLVQVPLQAAGGPPPQVRAMLLVEQTTPQALQLSTSVLRFVSQPLEAIESQSAKPALQVKVQAPAEQPMPVALSTVAEQLTRAAQVAPQVAVAFKLVSQPLDAVASQLPNPPLQVKVHAPAEQPMLVAFCTEVVQLTRPAQVVPQPAVRFRLVSHPLDATPSQLPKPLLQVKVQLPAEQPMAVAFCTEVVQSTLLPQVVPQVAVALSEVSQPLAAFESQLAKFALQVKVQAPDAQPMLVAFCTEVEQFTRVPQAVPQVAVALRLISQPLSSLSPSQSAKLPLQVPLHTPGEVQVGEAMLLFEHTLPQPPQLLGSL